MRTTKQAETQDGEQTTDRGPTLGYAAVLAREDVQDPSDPAVGEAIEEHEDWADRQRRRAQARREDRETLTLGDFEDDERGSP